MPAQDLRQRLPTGGLLHFRNHAAGPAAAVKALRLLTDPADCPRRRVLSGAIMPRLNECRHASLLFAPAPSFRAVASFASAARFSSSVFSVFREEVAEKVFRFPFLMSKSERRQR